MVKVKKESFQQLLLNEGISMAEFARKLDISRSQLWRILNEKSNPGAEFIAKFKGTYPTKKFEDYFFVESVA